MGRNKNKGGKNQPVSGPGTVQVLESDGNVLKDAVVNMEDHLGDPQGHAPVVTDGLLTDGSLMVDA